ncbi:FMN-linked oxidoreductase [Cylindrobasidium torrendii FP15055 ss-10]|uniref:FMN-linked oxidoreductase n=1 Tax=Cylindrobasidium torrendii FP15055 ss-10 TaxID=1314674 RepID=A0A0D7BAH9_9AGAR|nr:FMN-linked oxidoreductase [Cylindrobasidium torrendii FP15055 ss-10]
MPSTKPAPNVSFFTPLQDPPAGAAVVPQTDDKPIPTLFQPLTIRGTTFQNRLFFSPCCQYSADNGFLTPWHIAHVGGILMRGPGLSIIEAAAVVPEGRLTPEDLGIWDDAHMESLKPLVEFAHSQSQKIGIQLGHAGRKTSTTAPWLPSGNLATPEMGGWPNNAVAPSAIPYDTDYPMPRALETAELKDIVQQWADAAARAVKAGFDVIEIHGAHGYLISEFLSPTSNQRTDAYGGSFENRIRFPLEIVDAVRAAIPADMPLFFRISGSENLEISLPDTPSWRVEDTARLAPILHAHGIDFLDVSSGGNHPAQKTGPTTAYQAPFAEAAKKAAPNLVVGSVGRYTDAHIAQNALDKGMADVILVGRGFLKDPALVWTFAEQLGVEVNLANQIYWAFRGRRKQGTTTA